MQCGSGRINVGKVAEPKVFSWSHQLEGELIQACLIQGGSFSKIANALIPRYRELVVPEDPIQVDRSWYLPALREKILPLLREPHSQALDECLYLLIWLRFRFNRENRYKSTLLTEDQEELLALVKEAAVLLRPVTIMKGAYKKCGISYPLEFRTYMLRMHYEAQGGIAANTQCLHSGMHVEMYEGGFKFWEIENYTLRVRSMAFCNGQFVLEGFFPNRLSIDLGGVLSACLEYDDGSTSTEALAETGVLSSIKYLGIDTFELYAVKVVIPAERFALLKTIRINFDFLGKTFSCRCMFARATARLCRYQNYNRVIIGKRQISYDKDQQIIQFSDLEHLSKNQFLMALVALKRHKIGAATLRLLYVATRRHYRRQRIWLYFDKLYKAGDNGEYLFQYASKQNDGIRHCYIINANAPDYRRLKKQGLDVLKFGSIRERLAALNAQEVLATHSGVAGFLGFSNYMKDYFADLLGARVSCIQHGLTVQYIPEYQARIVDNTEHYYCASKYEVENLLSPSYDYQPDQLRLTGIPRYDGLLSRPTRTILLSPTWRRSLTIDNNAFGTSKSYNPSFKHSAYFRCFNELINNQELLEALSAQGYTLQYLLHPTLSVQKGDFDVPDGVEILAATDDVSYEKLLCGADVLVTDYSGIQFDFAYMRKPLIYFRPDFLPPTYAGKVFGSEESTFGPVAGTSADLIAVIRTTLETGCVMSEKYRRRTDDFFAHDDHDNCKRIYEDLILQSEKDAGSVVEKGAH